MSADDEDLFGKMIRIENKDIFVDLRKNSNGIYLKLSERKGTMRKTVLIPSSGISKLQAVLEEVSGIIANQRKGSNPAPVATAGATSTIKPVSTVARAPAAEIVPSTSIYVAGLTWETTEEELIKHFQQAGKVVKASILRKPRRGKIVSMGCGIVEYASIADATKAISLFNDTVFNDRTITCREDRKGNGNPLDEDPTSKGRARTAVPTKVFVTNVGADTSTEDVVEHFTVVGDVKKLEKVTGKGKKRGIWIIEYDDAEFAADAIARLNESELDGNVLIVREYFEND